MRDSFDYHSFCPYRVCPLGAHVDHQNGLVTGFALDKGITFDFSATDDGSINVVSKNYDGTADGSVFDDYERQYYWGDFIFGAVKSLSRKYKITRGIEGVVSGSLTAGGLSSSASVILTYLLAFAKVNEISLTAPELIQQAIFTERNFIGVNVGKLDQSCEVYCRKDNLLYLDTLDDSSKLLPIPKAMKDFEIAIIFTGKERNLSGSAYNMRVDECKAASYALKDFAHMDYGKFNETVLRDVPYGIFLEHKNKLPPNWRKRAEHYYGEIDRVKKAMKIWQEGDIDAFGKLIFASGDSSINLYQTGSEELKTLHEIMKETDGVFGSRFSGAGFNGSAMALVAPEKEDEIERTVREKYLKKFPEFSDAFKIVFCRTADGVKIN